MAFTHLGFIAKEPKVMEALGTTFVNNNECIIYKLTNEEYAWAIYNIPRIVKSEQCDRNHRLIYVVM